MPTESDTQASPDLNKVDPELAQLEAMIAADEAAEAVAREPRDEQGRFKSAKEAERAGQVQDKAQVKDAEGPPTILRTEDNSGTPAAKEPEAKGLPAQAGPELSRYEKAKEREKRSWAKINEQKLAIEAEKAKLDSERKALAQAQPKAKPAEQTQTQAGYSAEQYEAGAEQFEARGEFDLADAARERAAALRLSAQAGAAPTGAQQPAAPQAEAWTKAKADFPEIIDPQSPAREQLIAFIKQHPAVLDYPQGPYLAASLVVSQLHAARVPDLSKEAARVPELLKHVESLTAKVKELEGFMALPSSGSPTSRGDIAGEKPWSERSTREMEAALEREFASLT